MGFLLGFFHFFIKSIHVKIGNVLSLPTKGTHLGSRHIQLLICKCKSDHTWHRLRAIAVTIDCDSNLLISLNTSALEPPLTKCKKKASLNKSKHFLHTHFCYIIQNIPFISNITPSWFLTTLWAERYQHTQFWLLYKITIKLCTGFYLSLCIVH